MGVSYQLLYKFLIDDSTESCWLWSDPQPSVSHVVVHNEDLSFVETEKIHEIYHIFTDHNVQCMYDRGKAKFFLHGIYIIQSWMQQNMNNKYDSLTNQI